MSDVVNIGAGVPDLSQVNAQARQESMQRRLLSAQLAASVLSGVADEPSGLYVTEICEAFDSFLTVE